jgi:hypothetical protein
VRSSPYMLDYADPQETVENDGRTSEKLSLSDCKYSRHAVYIQYMCKASELTDQHISLQYLH